MHPRSRRAPDRASDRAPGRTRGPIREPNALVRGPRPPEASSGRARDRRRHHPVAPGQR
ncbi:unnamed protein product [Rhodiola kirilowii]